MKESSIFWGQSTKPWKPQERMFRAKNQKIQKRGRTKKNIKVTEDVLQRTLSRVEGILQNNENVPDIPHPKVWSPRPSEPAQNFNMNSNPPTVVFPEGRGLKVCKGCKEDMRKTLPPYQHNMVIKMKPVEIYWDPKLERYCADDRKI